MTTKAPSPTRANRKPATPSEDEFALAPYLDAQEARHANDRRVERARLGELQDEIGTRQKNIERLSGAIAQVNATREAAGIGAKVDAEADTEEADPEEAAPADKV